MKIMNRRAGFTMLELLAVLAIVLILSAILFPAIESAREKSLTTSCGQNVKQLVLAVTQYEQDNGKFPAGRLFYNTTAVANTATDMVKWYNAVAPIMHASPSAVSSMGGGSSLVAAPQLAGLAPGDQGINTSQDLYPASFRCPSASNWDVASQNMSYGYNYQYLGNADPLSVVNAAATTGYVNYPIGKGSIQRPDRTICIADSDGTGAGSYISAATTPSGGLIADTSVGAFGYLLDPTFLPARDLNQNGAIANPPVVNTDLPPAAGGLYVTGTGVITRNGTPISQRKRSIVSDRHKGGANVGFLDGHVELRDRQSCYFMPSAPGVTPRLRPSNELWNGFGTDNDLNGDGLINPNEQVFDSNEAWVSGVAVPAGGLAPTSQVSYGTFAATGYAKYTGLTGSYLTFGPGFNTVAAFFNDTDGPTLPHKAPFPLALEGIGSVQ